MESKFAGIHSKNASTLHNLCLVPYRENTQCLFGAVQREHTMFVWRRTERIHNVCLVLQREYKIFVWCRAERIHNVCLVPYRENIQCLFGATERTDNVCLVQYRGCLFGAV